MAKASNYNLNALRLGLEGIKNNIHVLETAKEAARYSGTDEALEKALVKENENRAEYEKLIAVKEALLESGNGS